LSTERFLTPFPAHLFPLTLSISANMSFARWRARTFAQAIEEQPMLWGNSLDWAKPIHPRQKPPLA
jgi:hypothetical protein